MAGPASHPWAAHLNVRRAFRISAVMDPPDCHPPPQKFAKKADIAAPDAGRAKTRRECITLADVVAFRTRHDKEAAPQQQRRRKSPSSSDDDSYEMVDAVAEGMGGMRIAEGNEAAPRPVLYRHTGATKNKGEWTVLEASHFEVFMPDRKDLRYIVAPTKAIVEQCVEGHLFAVFDLHKLPEKCKLHPLKLQAEYPIVWSVAPERFGRVDSAAGTPWEDIIYVAKVMETGDARAVCNWSPSFITVHAKRFTQECQNEEQQLSENALYEAVMVDTSSAWVYPVEPPKNKTQYAHLVANVRSTSMNTGVFAETIKPVSEELRDFLERRLRLAKIPEQELLQLFGLGIRFRELIRPKESVNVVVQSVDPPELIVLSEVYVVDYVSMVLDKKIVDKNGGTWREKKNKIFLNVNSISHPRGGNNRITVLKCAPHPRMKQEFPNFDPKQKIKRPKCSAILEHVEKQNITLSSLELIEARLAELENPIGRRPMATDMSAELPALFEYLYGNVQKPCPPPFRSFLIRKADGSVFTPNDQQQQALSMYHGMNVPAFCILSPPGSGKTTVAAAMAASLVDNRVAFKPGEVQLLLAVQNVAVENLSYSLKSFDENRLRVYYIKSLLRTDLESRVPYDIKTLLPNYNIYMENAEDSDLIIMQQFIELDTILKEAKKDRSRRLGYNEKRKLTFQWHTQLRKAKATLEKYLQPQILLSTVDLALCYLQNKREKGIQKLLTSVTRVIIDEASLLTESTFYCLIRLFPRASFVLIGDNKQLPPFLFDSSVIGHLLTARSALSVALEHKNIPTVQLLEVYRAPQRLVDPYNGLSYDGQLVSWKREQYFPLSDAGLIERGRPQLLFVANSGSHSFGEQRSVCNRSEIQALLSLLQMFPPEKKDDIMIICLYKDQKKKLELQLGTNYELHTVDSAQGKEKPIVIVMTTRSDKRTPFFSSKERCNVAVSRQQQALIIIGNPTLLRCVEPTPWVWSTVLDSAHFTTIPAESLPPVNESTKEALEELIVDDTSDFTERPQYKPMLISDLFKEVEAHEQQQEKKKKNRRKEKKKSTNESN
ncbi:hypothetical protein PMAYCL1PPCAC_16815 [Pristionchus mayeri]|uniref:DNA2/NAM7 helicase-like C-terminal domain-containing protein n=1 Tax=Pristionchus mayeri TaxID=1317129 RepID=A0AAN5HZR7_9BILA|nr:hypothetical protein PMAYCL1PPCAC_16815 [Pristionchus mayeri]